MEIQRWITIQGEIGKGGMAEIEENERVHPEIVKEEKGG